MAFLKKIGRLLLRGLRNGDLPMFVLFLILALFFWLSQNMGGMYERTLSYSVELTGVEKGMRVTRPLTSPVYVTVAGPGTAMMRENRRKRVLYLDTSFFVRSGGNSSVASSTVLVDSLSSLLPSNLTVRRVLPDSLRYESVRVTDVKLPVRFGGTVNGNDKYRADIFSFSPDSVTVSVPEYRKRFYTSVATEAVPIAVSSSHMEVNLKLVAPGDDVQLYDDEVKFSIEASRMTEKTVEVPVSGINLPYGTILRTFPPKVKVQFQVSLTDFDNITATDFAVALDYRLLESTGYKAEVSVVNCPKNVSKVRATPQLVEYLIEKQSSAND